MKFSYSWLKEILQTTKAADEIAQILTSIGIEIDAIHKERDDFIFEASFTPNLSYATNILGIAREIAAVTGEKVSPPLFSLKEESEEAASKGKVRVENKEACPNYLARILTGVKVGPSPEWLVKRIESAGLRSVNCVVDLTNYVLLEQGFPLHAFDLGKLEKSEIVVRNAKPGEKIVTLDGKEHYPTPDTLLICDAQKPVAIAGVMGSKESEVTENTTTILLESAYFEPGQVRKASKRAGLHTEASHRYERGVDPNGGREALDRAASLMQQWAGAKVLHGVLESTSGRFEPCAIELRVTRLNKILGTQLALGEVEAILTKASGSVKRKGDDSLVVTFPTYRVDLKSEIDLIEEVARLYGYDTIFEKRKPMHYQGSNLPDPPLFLFEKKVRHALLGEGLQEFLTCDLISPLEAELIAPEDLPRRTLVRLPNPSSIDQSVLRPSLFANLLKVVHHNQNHGCQTLAGFEIGRIHFKTKEEEYCEPTLAAIVLTGKKSIPSWKDKPADVDFFDLKGIVENLFASLEIEGVIFQKGNHKNFHPGQQAMIHCGQKECGILGQVHPNTLKIMGIERSVFFAEILLDELMTAQKTEKKMKPLSPFPASSRDWTVKVSSALPAEALFAAIEKERSKLLEEFSLLDVYQSEKLGSEWKNMTFRFVYRDLEETISLKAVEEEHARITQNVMKQLN